MGDLSDKASEQVTEYEEINPQEPSNGRGSSVDGAYIKTCADCGTTKTPLWRGGPAGPKSLCNACGIRSRKKRRALMGINKEDKKSKKSTMIKQSRQLINNSSMSSSNNSSSSEETSSKMGEISLKKKLLSFGGKVAFQRPRSSIINQRRKLGEVEQAAFLLMALSCGSVYA